MRVRQVIRMTRKAWRECFGRYDFPVRVGDAARRLYRIDVNGIVKREVRRFETGVPTVVDPRTGMVYHNPVTVSFHALHLYDGFVMTGDGRLLEDFLVQARWLRDHSRDGAWVYPVPVPNYNANTGWKSAMAQGLAISVLTRAFCVTEESHYRDVTLRAAEVLTAPIEAGGCSIFDADGLPFLEEVAVVPPAHILNGAIFALWGLDDLQTITGVFEAFTVKAINRVSKELHRYDLGYWTRYDQENRWPASRGYHLLHIAQMTSLHDATKNSVFQWYAERWLGYLRDPPKRVRALAERAWYEIRGRTNSC